MTSKPKRAAPKTSDAADSIAKVAATANAVKVTPGHGVAGRHPTRELLDALSGNRDPGMFGRMFPKLPPLKVRDSKLEALAEAMLDTNPGGAEGNNTSMPAGIPTSASSSITISRSISPPSAIRRRIRLASTTSVLQALTSIPSMASVPMAALISMPAIQRPETSMGQNS